jgi:hypothetical protein
MKQRSKEWREAKLGKFSASDIVRLCGARGLGATGLSYIQEKGSEIITGIGHDEIYSKEIEWGEQYEPIAAEYYEAVHDFKFEMLEDGFKNYSKYSGCSPDRLIPEIKKGVEIKCPYTIKNHYKYLLIKDQAELKSMKTGSFNGQYYWQCVMGMLCYDYQSWDFVSFHPLFTGINRMKILTIQRDEKDIDFLKARIKEAKDILDKQLEYLKN